jgi:hypothetical protein
LCQQVVQDRIGGEENLARFPNITKAPFVSY